MVLTFCVQLFNFPIKCWWNIHVLYPPIMHTLALEAKSCTGYRMNVGMNQWIIPEESYHIYYMLYIYSDFTSGVDSLHLITCTVTMAYSVHTSTYMYCMYMYHGVTHRVFCFAMMDRDGKYIVWILKLKSSMILPTINKHVLQTEQVL